MVFQDALLTSLRKNIDRVAIECQAGAMTYAQLLTAADKVCFFLLEKGVDKEMPVGVSCTHRPDMIAAMIGIMQAGCVFVLLDPSLPRLRMSAMVADMDLRHIITGEGPDPSPEKEGKYIACYPFKEIMAVENIPVSLTHPAYDPEDSLYIYFTSGSTGVPKGIVGKNSSLLQFLRWEIDTFHVNEDTRVSQFISPYFDAFLRDVFVPLLAGGTICVPPADESFFSPEKLVSWIDGSAVHLIHCVPSLLRMFNNKNLHAGLFPALKYILLSGEKIIPSELTNWYGIFGTRIQLVNLYGATETTMIRSYYLIRPEDLQGSRIPIGDPIYDTSLLVAHKDLTPCDTLVPGDLYIISEYMTKGYLNNPELTREKFIHIDGEGGKLKLAFKTGDRARILVGGKIDLIGREDRQIKLRGIRIEPDEIENVLLSSGLVKNAVVIKHTEDNGEESLICFITDAERGGKGQELPDAVGQFLKDRLPSYMMPADIVQLDNIPSLSNGKTDYKALSDRLTASVVIAPVDDIESKILSIWKDILGDKPISTEDSFHKIGGNSLSIMKLIGRIYKEYNVRISLNDLFNNLTIRKQAGLIRHSNKDLLYIISPVQDKPAYHVASAQERMYYNQQLNKQSVSYNLPMAWEIAGQCDKNAIEDIFLRLIRRHETLRTEFRMDNGELLQFVSDTVDFHIEEIHQQKEDRTIQETILRLIRPFDMGKAPLIRCFIITGADGKKILMVDMHHTICDGLSQINLMRDFSRLYNGEELKPAVIQYKDYAEWEYSFRSTEEYLSHREFWLSRFEGNIPRLELPTTRMAAEDASENGGIVGFEISKKSLQPLLEHLYREEMTTFPGLFSLYFLFLSQLTGQEDIVIGVASSGRMQHELEEVVGMFVKTLPIRCTLNPELSFRHLVKEMNNLLIQANSRLVYDLANIVIELNNGRSAPAEDLFSVMFVFQNFQEGRGPDVNDAFPYYPIENSGSKYPLTLFAYEEEDLFLFRLEYLFSYFTRSDVELLAGKFRRLAEKISSNIDSSILEIVGAGEPQQDLIGDDVSFNF